MSRDGHNGVMTRAVNLDVEDDFAIHEKLPPPLRNAIIEMHQLMSSKQVYDVYMQRGILTVLAMLREQERREILRFGSLFKRKTGTELPHVAAMASIQRYKGDGVQTTKRRHMLFDDGVMHVTDLPYRRTRKGVK